MIKTHFQNFNNTFFNLEDEQDIFAFCAFNRSYGVSFCRCRAFGANARQKNGPGLLEPLWELNRV